MDIVQEIVKGHEFEASSWKGLFFHKVKTIKLKEDVTQELFSKLFAKTCELLGKPIYVHSFYGYIWKVNGEVLAYNVMDDYYHSDVLTFFVFKNMPIGRKLKYATYTQIDEVVKQVFSENNLDCGSFIHYYDRSFSYLTANTQMQYLLLLKQYSLEFYCSKKEPYQDGMTRVVPHYSRKKFVILSDLSMVKRELQSCFNID